MIERLRKIGAGGDFFGFWDDSRYWNTIFGHDETYTFCLGALDDPVKVFGRFGDADDGFVHGKIEQIGCERKAQL